MYEKMMKYKKVRKLFCDWIYDKYGFSFEDNEFYKYIGENPYNAISYEYYPENDIILCLMPFFFDEQGIVIEIFKNRRTYMYEIWIDYGFYFGVKNRLKALQAACEKAFEILEERL